MRKVLLLGAALLVSAGIMAQSTSVGKLAGASNKYEKVQKYNRVGDPSKASTSTAVKPSGNVNNKAAQALTKTDVGVSANCFSVLMSQSTCLTANEALGLIMMTHRQDGTTMGSGYIQASFSTDGGFTFDNTTATVWDGTTPNLARYPSGVIYNPTGNTTPANAFAVVAGPLTDNSGWFGGYFASEKLDGTLNNSQTTLFTTDTAGGVGNLNQMPRMHMQSRGDKVFLYGDDNTDDGTYYTGFTTVLNLGTWNAGTNSVDWVRVPHTPGYLTDGLGNPDGYAYPGFAMCDDGLNGYLIYIGRDGSSTDQLTYQPLVYKTADGGLTWTKQAAFNWATIPTLVTHATNLSPVSRPLFSDIRDITIDMNGNPHIVAFIQGAYTDNIDSLGYYAVYTGMKGVVFDVFKTSTGWDAIAVDTVYGSDPDETTTLIDPGTTDAVAWDERFQMSRTEDGSKIFYAWMDTDPTLSDINLFPDVNVKMLDVATGTLGPRVNLTKGTDYDAMNYWMYLSDVTFDMTSYYQLNITTSTLETNSNNPVTHQYINGAYLDESGNLYAGINDLPLDAAISMYPNPTTGDLNISFNNLASGSYNVVVFNAIGSAVLSQNMDINGAMVRTINMNELPTGIYMVQVSNDNGTTTKKVIKN